MKKTLYVVLGAALFLSSASFAFAAQVSGDGSALTPQAFVFTCDPYASASLHDASVAFQTGQAYLPTNDGTATCYFSIPQASGAPRFIAIYKGVPGQATLQDFGVIGAGDPNYIFDMSAANFDPSSLPGDPYFTISAAGDASAANNYFTSNSGTAPSDYSIVNWFWGAPATVTADNQNINTGDPLPTFTSTISGFINGDTLATSGITGQANCSTTATNSSVAGDYPITCTQGTLSSSKYSFTVPTASYIAGNLHIAAVTQTDTQPPVVTIATPINGHSYLQNDVVFISSTATDASGVVATSYTLNGVAVDPNAPLPFMSEPLGTTVLVASSSDTFGNIGYATSTFTILPPDLTPPTVVITSPQNGASYTDTATVFLTASITDVSPIAATSYTFDGATIDPTQPLPLLGATLGPATVSVSATDAYGNAASSTVTFTIKSSDITPPTIVVTSPIAGHSYMSTASVVPSVSVTDASGIASATYTLDNIPVDPTQPLPLSTVPSGKATFSVSATDNFGNSTTTNVVFTITAPPPPDTTPPTIVITSPVAGKLYSRTDTVMLTATITDKSGVAHVLYYFDGKPVDPTKPLPFSKATLGNASTTVVATDNFGNTGSSTVNFRIEPSIGSCEAEILDAFNHRYIPNQSTFSRLFDDCRDLSNYDNDRNNDRNDDSHRGKDCNLDTRYIDANNNVDKTYQDIDKGINR